MCGVEVSSRRGTLADDGPSIRPAPQQHGIDRPGGLAARLRSCSHHHRENGGGRVGIAYRCRRSRSLSPGRSQHPGLKARSLVIEAGLRSRLHQQFPKLAFHVELMNDWPKGPGVKSIYAQSSPRAQSQSSDLH